MLESAKRAGALFVAAVIIAAGVLPRPGRAATGVLEPMGSFEVPGTSLKITDFIGSGDRLYMLTTARDSIGKVISEVIVMNDTGRMIRRWPLPPHCVSQTLRVSPSGRVAVLERANPASTIPLLFSGEGQLILARPPEQGLLSIEFVGEALLGIKYDQVDLIGGTANPGPPKRIAWLTEFGGPFYSAGTGSTLFLADPVQVAAQTVNIQNGAKAGPFPINIPGIVRNTYGPDEGVFLGMAAAPDGTLYCGLTHSQLSDGAQVVSFDEKGVIRGIFKCQLPTFPEMERKANPRGYLFPGMLAATHRYLYWLDPKFERVSYYARPTQSSMLSRSATR